MSDAGPSRDPHAAARANIRDTTKWLITGLAGIAAAIIGTSPLTATGLGSPMPPWRLTLAIGGGAIGLLLVGIALEIAIRILVTKPFFFGDIGTNDELRNIVNEHRDDLLPPEVSNYETFRQQRTDAIAVLRGTTPGNRDTASETYELGGIWIDQMISFAYFEKMRLQMEAATRWLFALAFLAAISFTLFAWAANPGKPDAKQGVLPPKTSTA